MSMDHIDYQGGRVSLQEPNQRGMSDPLKGQSLSVHSRSLLQQKLRSQLVHIYEKVDTVVVRCRGQKRLAITT